MTRDVTQGAADKTGPGIARNFGVGVGIDACHREPLADPQIGVELGALTTRLADCDEEAAVGRVVDQDVGLVDPKGRQGPGQAAVAQRVFEAALESLALFGRERQTSRVSALIVAERLSPA